MPVTINTPFKGGHIIHAHAERIPWIQIELSRASFLTNTGKGRVVIESLKKWMSRLF
jgi:hypothetical protein